MSMRRREISLRSIAREVRDGFGSISMRAGCGSATAAAGVGSPVRWPQPLRRQQEEELLLLLQQQQRHSGRWADLPPELLRDVMQRVEEGGAAWPARRDVVACAAVCWTWQEAIREIVRTPEECSRITFPISLKQPGPRDVPIQCFIRREQAAGLFYLYLGLTPALQGENGKLLLVARKIRRGTSIDYVISLVSDEFSRASGTYVGKIRSNFLGTKFTIYDSQPPHDAIDLSSNHFSRRINSRKVSPRAPTCNHSIGTVSYEFSLLRTRGPRRMECTMNAIPASAVMDGGAAPTPTSFVRLLDEQFPVLSVSKPKDPLISFSSTSFSERQVPAGGPLILKNKSPRWHEQLQCWCLNFRGRVTVASVKNFQLVATGDSSADQDQVILQFGKIGKDIFTMDYRYPLSAFQAFAICLSSFDTKPVCE